MNNQGEFGNQNFNPNLPPVINPAWNPNNWNQQQSIRNLENRVTRLEREVQRLNNRVNRIEQNMPWRVENNTYQKDSYNMM